MMKKAYIGLRAWDMGFDAHLTVAFLGDIDQEREFYIREKIAQHRWDQRIFYVARKKIELFGPNNDIPVITVAVPLSLRGLVEEMAHMGIEQNSEWPWNPHISLKLEDTDTIHIPVVIRLDKLYLG